MTEPTPSIVANFWLHLSQQFGSRVVLKSNSELMALVADALALLGVQDRAVFMERFATTIARTIYVPFEIGIDSPGWSLWGQIVVCAHEHEHVRQYAGEGVRFAAKYLTSGAQRAAYEAEAYRVGMELDWWRFGRMVAPEEQAARLRAYGCSAEEIESAAQILTLSQETIRYGGRSPVAQVAIAWLEANAPDLRERHLTAAAVSGRL